MGYQSFAPLLIVGQGRLASALERLRSGIASVSFRRFDFRTYVQQQASEGGQVLIAARDDGLSPKANVRLVADIAAELVKAGYESDRIIHAGSYGVCAPFPSAYRLEKRLLEEAVCKGLIPGNALRIPIVRIEDDRFRGILGEICDALLKGSVSPRLELVCVTPIELLEYLTRWRGAGRLKIVPGTRITIGQLVEQLQITPTSSLAPSSRRRALEMYTEQISHAEGFSNHYVQQHEMVVKEGISPGWRECIRLMRNRVTCLPVSDLS